MTIPLWRTDTGLPLGLQMLARLGGDEQLVAVAEWMITTRV